MDKFEPHKVFEVKFQKKPPFFIQGIIFNDSFYMISAKQQEEALKFLRSYVVRYRGQKYREFIKMAREA